MIWNLSFFFTKEFFGTIGDLRMTEVPYGVEFFELLRGLRGYLGVFGDIERLGDLVGLED